MTQSGIYLQVGEEEVVDIAEWSCHCGQTGHVFVFKGISYPLLNCPECQCQIKVYGGKQNR